MTYIWHYLSNFLQCTAYSQQLHIRNCFVYYCPIDSVPDKYVSQTFDRMKSIEMRPLGTYV